MHRQAPNKDIWVLDSGCSNHMTGNEALFSTLSRRLGGLVEVGTGKKCQVLGRGIIGKHSESYN